MPSPCAPAGTAARSNVVCRCGPRASWDVAPSVESMGRGRGAVAMYCAVIGAGAGSVQWVEAWVLA